MRKERIKKEKKRSRQERKGTQITNGKKEKTAR